MSNSKQAAEPSTVADDSSDNPAGKNLIQLESGTSAASLPNELNKKIGMIDADLDDLRSELSSANKGVKSKLLDLSEKGSDLTSKVSEAYRQLGELDSAYKSLSGKSTQISKEIKSVTKQLAQVSEKTESEMGTLNDGLLTLIERTDELSKKSKLTTKALNKSIKGNAKLLHELEGELLNEIHTLATDTQQRDDALDNKTDVISQDLVKAEEEIKAGQARLLKMQAVDQALENRIGLLDSTAQDLSKKSRELSRSTTILNNRTSELATAIEELRTQTAEHSEQISDLQGSTEQTARALYSLIMVEKKHFRYLGGSIALLLVTLLGFYLYNNSNWLAEQQQNQMIQSGVTENSQQLAANENLLLQLGDKALQNDKVMQQEIETLNQQISHIGDQVDTLDGRVSNNRPNSSIGKNDIIHSDHWIAQQPAENFTIHIASVSDKQQLYKLAERYSNQLQDELAYLPVTVNQGQQFALVYGTYATRLEAESKLNGLPRYIDRKRPSLHTMKQVQTYLTN
jgi:chromosome segregation ATPase